MHIPDTVTSIGERAFGYCSSMKALSIGSGLTEIKSRTFQNATALKTVVIPSNVKKVGDYAFYKCTALERVTLAEGVEEIGMSAFYGVEGLQRLSLPNTLTTIGKYAFKGCSYLQSVVLGSNIKSIDAHAFYGCKNLTVYLEADTLPEGWHVRWNTSYRPTVWGCELSEDGKYVVALTVTEDNVVNKKKDNVFTSPKREGYTFGGWLATIDGVEEVFSAEEIDLIPIGTRVVALWNLGDEPLVEIPVEETEKA